MVCMDDSAIRARIEKDIALFYSNISSVKSDDPTLKRIIDLSEMYARDSKSYLEKGDFYTSFSCISYAHGLLDSVKEIIK